MPDPHSDHEATDDVPPADAPGDADDALGAGLFEADMGPSSALAHVYRGEIHA